MPWPVDLTLMVRSLIGDLDKTKYTDERIKQILVVGAYNVNNDADFNVETRKSGMSLDDIQTAIYNGYTVYWKNRGYEVVKDKTGQYLIKCTANSYCVGLTRTDGTLVEDPKHFFLGLEN